MRLTQRFNLALIAVGIVPLALLTAYSLFWFHNSVRQSNRQALQTLAAQVGRETGRALRDGTNALDFLSKHPALLNPSTPEETLKRALQDSISFHPILRDIYVLEPSSRVRASARFSFRGEWSHNQWFNSAMAGNRIISDVHTMLYPLTTVMSVAQPLRGPNNALSGVLIGQFNMNVFTHILSKIFDADGQALIIDHRGYVVAPTSPEQTLTEFAIPAVKELVRSGQPGLVDFHDPDGMQVAAVQPVLDHSWSVVLIRPQKILYAASIEMQRGLYATLGVTFLALLGLGVFFSRHLRDRLRLVFTAARSLRKRENIPLDDIGHDELADLIRMMSEASTELQESERRLVQHQTNLEHLVQQRSQDLRQANSELKQEIAERAQTQKALAKKQDELELLLRTAPVGIALCQDFRLSAPNGHLCLITGYSLEELDNMAIARLMPHFKDFLQLKGLMDQATTAVHQPAPPGTMECLWVTREGISIQVLLSFSRLNKQWILTVMDISKRKAIEEQLRHMALHDPLTGLGNRTLCMDRLQQALARSRREVAHFFALAFVDLDRFKVINDSQGHAVGDSLLQEVAVRLQNAAREVDTVCRFGGDEFLVLLSGLDAPANAVTFARRLQAGLREPYFLGSHEFKISASIGLFISRGSVDMSADQIIQRGNIAMHWAKESGRNRFKVFTKRLMNQVEGMMTMENDLRQAVPRGELFLEYQPILHGNGSLFGFEALVRWQHPLHGRIPPDSFIPAAEETGVIHQLGEWVLLNACRTIAAWNMELGADLTISVNMSGRQFGQANIPGKILACLEETSIAPERLKLEITETSLMKHLARPLETLGQLRQMGVLLSVDDFGTGYSSLSYLQQLPLDYLKIDRSFVRVLASGTESMAIVQAIIQLGHTLGMRIIAEGVETAEHLELLQNLGCDLYQGYYFARPLPEADALTYARNARS